MLAVDMARVRRLHAYWAGASESLWRHIGPDCPQCLGQIDWVGWSFYGSTGKSANFNDVFANFRTISWI